MTTMKEDELMQEVAAAVKDGLARLFGSENEDIQGFDAQGIENEIMIRYREIKLRK